MARKSFASLLALLAVLAIGLIGLVRAVVRVGVRPAESVDAPASRERADPSQRSPTLIAAQETGPILPFPAAHPGIDTSALPAARESAAIARADLELKDALWVEGHVIVPLGTPADEHAEIVADGTKFESRPLYRTEISPDGSFRVAFAHGTKMGVLMLEARYLYLDAVRTISPSNPPKDIVLEPRLGGCIQGRVIPPGGGSALRASIVGCRAQAHGSDSTNWQSPGPVERGAKVGEDLEFEFKGLPEFDGYSVDLHPPGLFESSRSDLHVEAGRILQLDLVLRLGARVSGRVVDEKGVPVAGASVRTRVEPSANPWGSGGATTTGADGTFAIAGIQPGRLTLQAYARDRDSAMLKVGDLDEGAVKDGIEIVLGHGLSVTGRVQWPDNRPVAGCLIELSFKAEPGQPSMFVSSQVHSKGNGTFEITGLAQGSIALTARARPRMGARNEPTLQSAGRTGIEPSLWIAHVEDVKPGTDGLVLTLQPGQSLRGRALDDTGRTIALFKVRAKPVRSAEESWREDAEVSRSYSGTDGSFEIDGLQDGEWTVTADARGYAQSPPCRVTLPRGSAPIDLVLPRAAIVSGVVVDPAGKPVPGAMVCALLANEVNRIRFSDRGDNEGVADSAGSFELRNVQPGSVRLVASLAGSSDSAAIALDLQPGQQVSGLRLALGSGAAGSRAK